MIITYPNPNSYNHNTVIIVDTEGTSGSNKARYDLDPVTLGDIKINGVTFFYTPTPTKINEFQDIQDFALAFNRNVKFRDWYASIISSNIVIKGPESATSTLSIEAPTYDITHTPGLSKYKQHNHFEYKMILEIFTIDDILIDTKSITAKEIFEFNITNTIQSLFKDYTGYANIPENLFTQGASEFPNTVEIKVKLYEQYSLSKGGFEQRYLLESHDLNFIKSIPTLKPVAKPVTKIVPAADFYEAISVTIKNEIPVISPELRIKYFYKDLTEEIVEPSSIGFLDLVLVVFGVKKNMLDTHASKPYHKVLLEIYDDASTSGTILNQRTLIFDENPQEIYNKIVYVNCYGEFETVYLNGIVSENTTRNSNIVSKTRSSSDLGSHFYKINHKIETNRVITVSTGLINRALFDSYQDLLTANEVFYLENNVTIPIVITEFDYKYNNNSLENSITISFIEAN